jgi:hypothetical protein
MNPDGSITETVLEPDGDINNMVIQDADGNVYVVNPDGTVTKVESTNNNESENDENKMDMEDKPTSMADNEFLYVTIAGRTDTLMDGHTLTLGEQSEPIKLQVGYKNDPLANRAYQTIDAGYRNNITAQENWRDSIHINRTKWKLSSQASTGTTFQFVPTLGTTKLEIDASEALSVILRDKVAEKDTLIAGNKITGNKITITIHTVKSGILRFKPKDEEYYKDYGFDDALMKELQDANVTTKDYDKIQISGTDYYVPWLGVLPNAEVEIKLEYTTPHPELDSLIVLEGDEAGLVFTKSNTNKLPIDFLFESRINLKTKNVGTYIINAYSYQKGNIKTLIGRLKVESKEYIKSKIVRIIRVRRGDESDYAPFTDAQERELVEHINKYYKQAFIKFELDTGNYQDTLTITKSSNEEIDKLNNDIYDLLPATQQKSDIYYLFICTQGNNVENGKGRLLGHYSVLFKPSGATPLHELGHNLGLQHTFENKDDGKDNICKVGSRILGVRTTKNIMDYDYAGEEHRRYFFKYQIDHLKTK